MHSRSSTQPTVYDTWSHTLAPPTQTKLVSFLSSKLLATNACIARLCIARLHRVKPRGGTCVYTSSEKHGSLTSRAERTRAPRCALTCPFGEEDDLKEAEFRRRSLDSYHSSSGSLNELGGGGGGGGRGKSGLLAQRRLSEFDPSSRSPRTSSDFGRRDSGGGGGSGRASPTTLGSKLGTGGIGGVIARERRKSLDESPSSGVKFNGVGGRLSTGSASKKTPSSGGK